HPEGPAGGRLALGDLAGRVEEHQVAAEGIEHQRGGHADRGQAHQDQDQSLVTRFHSVSVLRAGLADSCSSRASSTRCQAALRRWRRVQSSIATARAIIAYELQM